MSFVTSHEYFVPLISTSAEQICPPSLTLTLVIHQRDLGSWESTIIPTWFTERGGVRACHFFLKWRSGRWFYVKWLQKWLASIWLCFQRCRPIILLGPYTACGNDASRCPMRRRLGVIGSKSVMSDVAYLSGFKFKIPSASTSGVFKTSSGTTSSIRITGSDVFTDLISRSQVPPKCGERGGLNQKLILCSASCSFKVSSRAAKASLNSLSPPWKLVPLS